MNVIEKRDFIHNYLFRLVDRDIDEVYNKVKKAVEKDTVLTDSQYIELQKRVLRHKNNESKSFSWSEIKERLK